MGRTSQSLKLSPNEQKQRIEASQLAHGEATLTAQAATLDALFHKLIGFGLQNMNEGYPDAADRYMRLEFRGQAQCRMSWEALNEIKNPRPVAFIKQQTNVAAGHQQVNNHARGESDFPPNELNGVANAVDGRVEAPATGADPAMETVGTFNGAQIARGQGDVVAKLAGGESGGCCASWQSCCGEIDRDG